MSSVRETFGLACPNCGSDEKLVIEVKTFVRLSPEGTESAGHEEWWDDGYCCCEECKQTGTVLDFTIDRGGAS